MALVKCKECGHEISKKASECPSCGAPRRKGFPVGKLIALLLAGVVLVWWFQTLTSMYDSGDDAVASVDEEAIRARMRERIDQALVDFREHADERLAEMRRLIEAGEYKAARTLLHPNVADAFPQARLLVAEAKRLEADAGVTEARRLIESGDYAAARNLLREDPVKSHVDAAALAATAEELHLVERLESIPAAQLERNRDLYARLVKLNPDEPRYREKRDHYQGRIDARNTAKQAEAGRERKERESRVARFGEPPHRSAWDGSYRVVEKYLQATAHDPDSIEIDGCTKLYHTNGGWLVGCDYRGRNAFGGMIRKSNWFTIVRDRVVQMHEPNAYRP